MDPQQLTHRFKHHPPADRGIADKHSLIRDLCLGLALELNDLLPEGDEKDTAMRRLEETMFWSNAAVARGPQNRQDEQQPADTPR